MNKDKMIEFAKEQCEIFPEDSYMGKYLRETIKMLQAEPSEDAPDANVGSKKQAEPCEDCVSRKSLKHKLQERHDFFVDAYGGFGNLSQKDKARVDVIANCIAMVVNEPPVKPTQRWIPVSERLPEVHEEPYYADHEEILHESDHVLTCCQVGKEFVYAIGTVIHDEVCNSYEWSGLYDYAEYVIDDMQVLAWMPLPEPYKGGEEE